ncbi:Putative ribonuclease H protein At1g65750 [Linum perenne]
MVVFSNGSYYGIEVIVSILHKFASWSGLRVNPSKCELFGAGIPDITLAAMQRISGFRLGLFPRVTGWSSKTLTFSGRLQLVNSVLMSLAHFWMRVFSLPLGVIIRIQQICAGYLWGGNEGHSGGKAKVSWSEVTFPKKEGGLGLKDLKLWNRAHVFRLLWEVFASQGSIWVAWLRSYRVKGRDLSSLSLGSSSWVWRRLIKHRQAFLSHYSTDGEFHKWDNIPHDGIQFSVIWNSIRNVRTRVSWYHLVWGSGCRPRNSFFAWLYSLRRLSTKDRLIRWGIPCDPSCVLCSTGAHETHEHLYFDCDFSKELCSTLLGRIVAIPSFDGALLSSKFSVLAKGKAAKSILARIIWTAVIARIWKERCSRTHGSVPNLAVVLAKQILQELGLQAVGNCYISSAVSSFGFSLQL